MRSLKLIGLLAVLFLTACSKNDVDTSNCVANLLREQNLVRYEGQEIGCKSFYHLYVLEGEQYFLFDNYCFDLITYPMDCFGDIVCGINGVSCRNFYEHAEHMGIIAIQK